MSYSDRKIAAPVSINDVQRATGNQSNDLGTLCRGRNINQWSKMKPVAFPYIEPNRNQAVSAYGKTLWWWKGHPSYIEVAPGLVVGNYTCQNACVWITCCGVKFLGFSTKADVLGAFNPITNRYRTGDNSPLANNFVHVPPVGGSDEPFRLVDFNYYWQNAEYNIIPDYGTESGTQRIIAQSPEAQKVACGIMCPSVANTGYSEISFNDLFREIGSNVQFTIVTGKLVNNNFSVVNLSTTITRNDDNFKEVAINLNDSQVWSQTVLGIYCAAITIGNTIYYVPLMQSSGDHPNTYIYSSPNRKCYNSWYVDSNTPYYAITFTQKQNYGPDTSFPYTSVNGMTNFMTNGVMNRWYLKISMPKKTATYSFGNNAFKIEFTGQFRDSQGRMNLVYYALTSSDTRFVLKNNQVTDNYDWGTTETVTVEPGTGTKECYLAMYTVFANRNSVETIYGGTIWRVRLFFLNGQSDFSSEPDVVYGSLDSNHLNINVPAVTA